LKTRDKCTWRVKGYATGLFIMARWIGNIVENWIALS
jgi:hypothetical protein